MVGPGIARALPRLPLCEGRASSVITPRDLKAEAIRLQPLTGLSKRSCAAKYGMAWSTVYRWFNPRSMDDTPHPRFVQWLKLHADIRAAQQAAVSLQVAR
jgi:hypothetical protein